MPLFSYRFYGVDYSETSNKNKIEAIDPRLSEHPGTHPCSDSYEKNRI